MTSVIIFCAKYLFVVLPLLVAVVFLRQRGANRRVLILRAMLVVVVSVVLAKGGGALYDEPRPFVVRQVAPLIPHDADNGFPSDHTLLSFACAFLLLPFEKRIGGVAVLAACGVGWGRVASLLHSPLDIVASLVFAALANLLAWGLVRPARHEEQS